MSALVSKLALATVAAVGLYVATVGVSVTPGSCLRTVGVAAAAPSPTCGGDERECLHASVKTGLYGVRYVSPEDVARCVEAFNACIHGTLQGNPNSPSSTSEQEVATRRPCRNTLESTAAMATSVIAESVGTRSAVQIVGKLGVPTRDTGEFTGKISGIDYDGDHHNTPNWYFPGRLHSSTVVDYLGPVTYVFSPDGGVTFTAGPNPAANDSQRQLFMLKFPDMTEVMEGTATWSKIE